MKPFALLIDEQKLNALDRLITAAGKSPATDGQMMLLASQTLMWIKAEMEAAQKPVEPPKLVPNGEAAA